MDSDNRYCRRLRIPLPDLDAAVIEVGTREQRLFIGDPLADLPDHLGAFDVLAGVDIRPSLRSVSLDPDRDRLFVREGDDVRALDPADIHAVRLSEASAGVTVGPAHDYSYDSRSCTLKVTLDDIEPPIWRRLDVPASVTLARLHDVCQVALGWTNSHLHMFEIGDQRIAIPRHR